VSSSLLLALVFKAESDPLECVSDFTIWAELDYGYVVRASVVKKLADFFSTFVLESFSRLNLPRLVILA
jgi:hypothetical protein